MNPTHVGMWPTTCKKSKFGLEMFCCVPTSNRSICINVNMHLKRWKTWSSFCQSYKLTSRGCNLCCWPQTDEPKGQTCHAKKETAESSKCSMSPATSSEKKNILHTIPPPYKNRRWRHERSSCWRTSVRLNCLHWPSKVNRIRIKAVSNTSSADQMGCDHGHNSPQWHKEIRWRKRKSHFTAEEQGRRRFLCYIRVTAKIRAVANLQSWCMRQESLKFRFIQFDFLKYYWFIITLLCCWRIACHGFVCLHHLCTWKQHWSRLWRYALTTFE